MELTAGIDPGGDGAISIINADKEQVYSCVMPKTDGKSDYDACFLLILSVLRQYKVGSVYIEKVSPVPMSNAGSNFKFGQALQSCIDACLVSDIDRHVLVHPKTWQKKIWTDSDLVYKGARSVDTKPTSKNAAQRLFPNADLTKSKAAYTAHDGICDSLLIAYYGLVFDTK